jgi:hypothetical protein
MYDKVFDVLLVLRDTREHFSTYSASDINALIASKMKSVREPKALQKLYKLHDMIAELRLELEKEKHLKTES